MEIVALVFSGISAIAAALSAVAAFKSKKEVQKMKQANYNKIKLQAKENNGSMVGINDGEINEQNKN